MSSTRTGPSEWNSPRLDRTSIASCSVLAFVSGFVTVSGLMPSVAPVLFTTALNWVAESKVVDCTASGDDATAPDRKLVPVIWIAVFVFGRINAGSTQSTVGDGIHRRRRGDRDRAGERGHATTAPCVTVSRATPERGRDRSGEGHRGLIAGEHEVAVR